MTPYYQDGLVTLYHGDAREVLPPATTPTADLLLTDPPYGLAARFGASGRTIAGDEDTSLLVWAASTAASHVSDGWVVVFCGWNGNEQVQRAVTNGGSMLHTVIVWDKCVATSGRGDLRDGPGIREQHEFMVLASRGRPVRPWHGGNVWAYQRDMGDLLHPNQKPVLLMAAAISRLSVAGAVVLDPFAGSGSTLVAAKTLGRRAVGIELDERYCEIAATRCSQEVLGLVG